MSSSEMAYAGGSFISETCLIQSVRWGLLYANEAVQSNAKGGTWRSLYLQVEVNLNSSKNT
jgi:hypothetical protein